MNHPAHPANQRGWAGMGVWEADVNNWVDDHTRSAENHHLMSLELRTFCEHSLKFGRLKEFGKNRKLFWRLTNSSTEFQSEKPSRKNK
jgi:hypothetical protein